MTEPLTVYLFENDAEDTFAISRTANIAALPAPRAGAWTLKLKFGLAVDRPNPIGIAPEPILRGLAGNGYFVWSRHQINPFGTSQ